MSSEQWTGETGDGLDDPLTQALVRTRRFFTKAEVSRTCARCTAAAGGRRRLLPRPLEPRQGRPLHSRRELHRLLLVEGLRQGRHHHLGVAADRLPVGRAGHPEYEPRGCPRGAAFSWYTYSPTRVRYPYVRGVLLEMYREAKARLGDPVLAWADIVDDPERSTALQGGARQGRPGARHLGRSHRDRRRRPRPHHQEVGPGPRGRVLADPGDVDGVARLRCAVRDR